MRKAVAVALLLTGSALAVDGRSLLIGITIGLGLYGYQGTRNHVVMPTVRKIQRAMRPLPEDKKSKRARPVPAEQAKPLQARPEASTVEICDFKTCVHDGETFATSWGGAAPTICYTRSGDNLIPDPCPKEAIRHLEPLEPRAAIPRKTYDVALRCVEVTEANVDSICALGICDFVAAHYDKSDKLLGRYACYAPLLNPGEQ